MESKIGSKQNTSEGNVNIEIIPPESKEQKAVRYLLNFLYLITIVPYIFIMTVPSGLIAELIVVSVVIGFLFYLNFRNKKILKLTIIERERIKKRNKRIALVVATLVIFYMIYGLYSEGGSLKALFY